MDKFTFVGIEINRKAPHFTFIAIDETSEPLAIDTGTIESVLAYIAGLQHARVAVNGSLCLNKGYLKHSERRKNTPGKWPNMREVEYELEALGAPIYHTPDLPQKNDPVLHYGLTIADYLSQMGYSAPSEDENPRGLTYFEAPANTGFWSFVNSPMLEEDTLLGRVQRQLILYDLGLPIPNAMNFFEELTRFKMKHGVIPFDMILPPEELNAWLTAYTVMKFHQSPLQVIRLGIPEEGYIYLPEFPEDLQQPAYNSQQSLF